MSTLVSDGVQLTNELPLTILYQGQQHVLYPGSAPYSFGRDGQCDQVVSTTSASRVHAKIESRRGRFVLVDESTNGTYLQIEDAGPIFLRREEIPLQGRGVISFGEAPGLSSTDLLRFHF